MSMPVQVSIIIVNFNSGQYIVDCLESIYAQIKAVEFEIIVVDNGSTDGSLSEIGDKFVKICGIENSSNIGFGAANNIGARQAAGEYLFFLNPDTVLLNDCISMFIRFLSERGNDVVSCGGRLETAGSGYSVSFGNFPSVFQHFSDIGFRVLYKRFYNKHLSISPPCCFDSPQQVGYLSGSDIFIKKDIFLKMGGFDERFFMYFEDTDLFFRLSREGYKAFILPEARIVHFGDSALLPDGSFNYAKYAMLEKSKHLYFAQIIGAGAVFWVKAFEVLALVAHCGRKRKWKLGRMCGITLRR
jgi:GT2 family glycosyltransferase